MMYGLRLIGLLSAAFITMGSGGVSKVTIDNSSNEFEPTIAGTESTAADTVNNTSETTAEIEQDVSITNAASDQPTTATAPIPKTAAEMADNGAAIEVALSDDYIQGRYYTGDGLLGFDDVNGHVGVYFSDSRDLIGNIGLMSRRVPLFIEGLTLSVGARGYLALFSDPNDDVVGLAPGVEGRYGLPFDFPLAVVGNIFYSPDVLTLGDAEDILDIDARLEAEIVPNIVGFVGYREFRFDSDIGSDQEAASEIQLGARFAL